MNAVLRKLEKGLVVSCQALETEPLYSPEGGIMPRLARAAELAGAVGIRANTVRDIREIKAAVSLPVIGIIKQEYDGFETYITPTMREIEALAAIGVEIIAFDGTNRLHPDHPDALALIAEIRARFPEQLLMADISTYEEGMACAAAGVDLVSTTLCGYTEASRECHGLNEELIRRLAADCPAPVVAEGHVHTPELARRCLDLGAFCVVVGGAITRPLEIARRFVAAVEA